MHLDITERVLEITNSDKTKEYLAKRGKFVVPETQCDLFLTASENLSEISRKHMRRSSGNSPQRKAERTEWNFLSSSPTQSVTKSEYSFSQSTLSDSDASDFENEPRLKHRQAAALEAMHL